MASRRCVGWSTRRRDELGSIAGQLGNPHAVYYRYAGRTMGETGNNGSSDMSLSLSIAERQAAAPASGDSGTFRGGRDYGTSASDLTQSYDAINSYAQGSASGTYTVRSGDSLGSIALGLYGDANLWYKLAEANGLSAASALSEGMSLRLPAGVQRNQFNASTLTPYDPSEAVGDLSPTTPKPPKNNKCAVVGQLLLAVVAIAVTTLLLPGVGTATLGQSVLAAVGGSVASQGVGLATGLQDKFSFKSVALAALTAGVASKLGNLTPFSGAGKAAEIGNKVVTAAAASAISQGIGVATGLQSKFSWAGVAAAGVAAGVGQVAGGGNLTSLRTSQSIGNIASHIAVGAARSLAAAGTRSLIEGTSFGDNIIATLPDVLAQTIVDAVAGAVSGGRDVAAIRAAKGEAREIGLARLNAAKAERVRARQEAGALENRDIDTTKSSEPISESKFSGGKGQRLAFDAGPPWAPNGTPAEKFADIFGIDRSPLPPPPLPPEITTGTLNLALMAQASYDANGTSDIGRFNRLTGEELTKIGINPRELVNQESGFKAAIYESSGHYFLAFAGTDGLDWADIRTDLANEAGLASMQYRRAVALTGHLRNRVGAENITLTGHSLGGGLASLASARYGISAVTFNAAGWDIDLAQSRYGVTDNRSTIDRRITSVYVRGDPLTNAQNAQIASSRYGHEVALTVPGSLNRQNFDVINNHMMTTVIARIRQGLGR